MKKSTLLTIGTLTTSAILLLIAMAIISFTPAEEAEPVEEACEVSTISTIYLAIDETYELPEGEYATESNVFTLEDNVLRGLYAGKGSVMASECSAYEVIVSDLYTIPTMDNDKPFLPCGRYSQQENEFLDMILARKVEEAGFKTRAGVVAAARFMHLQFRYRLPYFYENGRMAKEKIDVDGEGRYYHKGLYLSEAKFPEIDPIKEGPATWGCELYLDELSKTMINGLNCSGYISWVLFNGGYDCGDIGAGPSLELTDLSDLGETVPIEDLDMSKLKAGDLLGFDGHIAIVLGLHEGKIYIGEEYWEGDLNVEELTYEQFLETDEWQYAILMDSYYGRDGNYSAYWDGKAEPIFN